MSIRFQKLAKRIAAGATAAVLALGFLPAAHAQAATEYKPVTEKAYEYDEEQGKYVRRAVRESTYDSKGRLKKRVMASTGFTDDVEIEKYVYGSNYKVTCKHYEQNEDQTEEYEGKDVYTFNGTALKRMISYDDDGAIMSKNLYETDANDRITKVTCYDYNEVTSKYEKEYILTIKYNSAGKMKLVKITVDGETYETNTFKYNSKGYLEKETIDYKDKKNFATITYHKYFHGMPQTMLIEGEEFGIKMKYLTSYQAKKQTLYDRINFFYGEHFLL